MKNRRPIGQLPILEGNFSNETRSLIVIPARGGSKGIPRKNLSQIHGKSLVSWCLQVAVEVPQAIVLLSSDDDEILSQASGHPEVMLRTRPHHLASDSSDDQSVLIDAISFAESQLGTNLSEILMLQPTSPSRTLHTVLSCRDHFRKGGYSSVWTVEPINPKVHPFKQLFEVSGYLAPWERTGKPWRRQELPVSYVRNGECYVFSKDCVLEDSTLMGDRCGFLISESEAVNIDTKDDLARAREILLVDENGRLKHVS